MLIYVQIVYGFLPEMNVLVFVFVNMQIFSYFALICM